MPLKTCKHKQKVKRVAVAIVTVEKTAIFCEKCNKQLTPYKYET